MGKFDRRNSMKMRRRRAQVKKKEREKRRPAPSPRPALGALPAAAATTGAPPRMRFKSRPAVPAPAPTSTILLIADLVPLEGAVTQPTVAYFTALLSGGQAPPLPEVVVIGSEHVVVDGNHRVYAAKALGWTQITVMVTQNKTNAAFRRDKLPHALRRGRKGFSNVEVVASEVERAKFTERERMEDEAHDFGR